MLCPHADKTCACCQYASSTGWQLAEPATQPPRQLKPKPFVVSHGDSHPAHLSRSSALSCARAPRAESLLLLLGPPELPLSSLLLLSPELLPLGLLLGLRRRLRGGERSLRPCFAACSAAGRLPAGRSEASGWSGERLALGLQAQGDKGVRSISCMPMSFLH